VTNGQGIIYIYILEFGENIYFQMKEAVKQSIYRSSSSR